MIRPLRPIVALCHDVPWCHLRKPHRPDGVGQVLLIFAALWTFYGVALMGDFPSQRTLDGLVVALQVLPLWVWSLLWLVAAVVCAGSAFLVGDQPGVLGFVAAWLPPFGWSCWYVAGVVDGASGRGLVLAGLFFAVGLIALRCSTLIDSRRIPPAPPRPAGVGR